MASIDRRVDELEKRLNPDEPLIIVGMVDDDGLIHVHQADGSETILSRAEWEAIDGSSVTRIIFDYDGPDQTN